jgi:electron transfer flavoprotein alpha subunit
MVIHSRHFICRLITSTNYSRCFASTLVLAEQIEGGKLAPVTLNTYVSSSYLSSCQIVCHIFRLTAAAQLKQDVECIIFGSENTTETANQLKKYNSLNIKKILVAENAAFKGLLSESITPVLLDLQKKNNYTHILGGSSTFAKGILPRLAALLDVQPISDITKVIDKDQYLRLIYAGNAILKLKSNDAIKIMTVRGTAFEAAKEGDGSGDIKIEKLESLDGLAKNDQSEFVTRQIQKSERPELPSARIVSLKR